MADVINCVCCGTGVGVDFGDGDNAYFEMPCDSCAKILPASLIKACADRFSYALGLRNGLILEFSTAKVKGDWVTISGFSDTAIDGQTPGGLPFPRGIDIRLDEIIWCADAPHGS